MSEKSYEPLWSLRKLELTVDVREDQKRYRHPKTKRHLLCGRYVLLKVLV
jgi:hypothetical protein